jgi:hypothetical protein
VKYTSFHVHGLFAWWRVAAARDGAVLENKGSPPKIIGAHHYFIFQQTNEWFSAHQRFPANRAERRQTDDLIHPSIEHAARSSCCSNNLQPRSSPNNNSLEEYQ